MKLLQNNFTTHEQSKRLLAMGIPANTADLYYERHSEIKFERLNIRLNKIELADDFFEKYSLYTPHWSVGRLIEIAWKCLTWNRFITRIKIALLGLGFNKSLVETIIDNVFYKMNFSKLED